VSHFLKVYPVLIAITKESKVFGEEKILSIDIGKPTKKFLNFNLGSHPIEIPYSFSTSEKVSEFFSVFDNFFSLIIILTNPTCG
jgi:hypothetical protein